MFVLVLPPIVAVLVALLVGGSLRGLSRAIRWWPFGVGAMLGELALSSSPWAHTTWLLTWGHWVWAASLVCVLAVLIRNVVAARGPGQLAWLTAAMGVGLNILVVFANNGYMPVAAAALDATGQTTVMAARTSYRRDVPIDSTTRLSFLADVVAEPTWIPRASVLSIGDALLIVGLTSWAFLATAPRGRTRPVNRGIAA